MSELSGLCSLPLSPRDEVLCKAVSAWIALGRSRTEISRGVWGGEEKQSG